MLDVHRSPNYNKTHIPILVGSSNSPDRSEWYALWPFFSGLKQGTRQEIRAPWPLLTMEGKDGKWKDIESWPLYQSLHKEWTEKDGTAHVLTSHEAPSILPLIAGNTRDGHKEGYFLGPLYTWDLRDKTHQDRRLLWQFAYHTKRPSGTTTALYPFWYKETNSKGESSWGIIYDLISRTKKEDGTKWRWLWFVEY